MNWRFDGFVRFFWRLPGFERRIRTAGFWFTPKILGTIRALYSNLTGTKVLKILYRNRVSLEKPIVWCLIKKMSLISKLLTEYGFRILGKRWSIVRRWSENGLENYSFTSNLSFSTTGMAIFTSFSFIERICSNHITEYMLKVWVGGNKLHVENQFNSIVYKSKSIQQLKNFMTKTWI